MYTTINFQTKTRLKEAVAKGVRVGVFQPGLGTTPENGETSVEGPHWPAAHAWYARVTLTNGVITKVK